jgi:hypothetical protein
VYDVLVAVLARACCQPVLMKGAASIASGTSRRWG